MKRLLSILAIVALIILSCVPAEQGIVPDSILLEGRELTVKAIMGDVAATKTAIQSDGTSIYWMKSDDINLFYGSSLSGRFTTGINSPSATADFSGTLSSTGVSNSGTPDFWAVYPYNAANSCDGISVTLTIPEAQEGTAGTFADKLNPSVAKASDTNLSFYNVGSWFIFSVAEEGVVSATLKGNGNEIIAGKVRVSMDDNSRPVAEVIEGEGKQSITMTPANGSSFAVGSYYYFVLLPQSLANGYTLTLTKSDNSSADCVISNERVFSRAQYRMKSNADEGLVYIPEGNIEFADGNVKTICVNHWDTDGDGELSYAEAAAVTSIPYNVFGGNTTITSFDEFRYFTSVTSMYNPFEGCTGLASIEIPSGVTSIEGAAFYGTNLTSIVIPRGVTSLTNTAFMNCPSLASIVVAEGNPNYDSRDNCNAIIEKDKYSNTYHTLIVGGTNTTIPSSVWYIGSFAFYGRTGLTSIEIPGTVQEMGPGTFTGCTGLTNIIFGSGFSAFCQGYDFQNCTGLTSIEIPSSVTEIGPGEFSGCTGLTSIEIPNSVSKIYDSAFEGCTGLTSIQVNPTTPPSGRRSMFDNTNNAPIYVPASSVNDYKTAEYWINYADRIKAIPGSTIEVTGVSLNNSTLSLTVGSSETLTATVSPDNATNKTVSWSTSDSGVASVSDGLVTAVGVGNATITVTTEDGGKTATCAVTVNPVEVTSVTLDQNTLSLTKGGTATLVATVNPATATNKTVTWSSNDANVATVDVNGKVTAVGGGSATITATAGGKSATCGVTVTVPVTGVSLNKTTLTLALNATETLTATVSPSNATNKNVTWSSNNTSVATVSSSGKVTAVASGAATITVKTKDGNKTATCVVTVTVPVTGVTLNKSSLSLKRGSSETLTATINPSNATTSDVTWSSSNSSIASVSNGTVTAKAIGNATITVTTVDGNKTATCAVSVTAPDLISFTLNPSSLTMFDGDVVTVTAVPNPSDAHISSTYWYIDYEIPASVVGNGLSGEVHAYNVGTTDLKVVINGIEKHCAITVLNPDPTEWVDLGLPSGLKWASTNQYATTSTEVGRAFTWADATSLYKNSSPGRLPTNSELQELLDNCDITELTSESGNLKFTSRINQKYIILPATGTYVDWSHNGNYTFYPYNDGGSYYWSSTSTREAYGTLGDTSEGCRLRWIHVNYSPYYETPEVTGGGQTIYKYPVRLVKP